MMDRPGAGELIDAARMHLEQAIIPAVRADRKLYFQTLVAINVLRIVERELELGPDHARAEWQRLNALLGEDETMPETLTAIKEALRRRNAALSESIRAGDYDESAKRGELFAHLKASVIEQLLISNPRLLGTIQKEEADPALDAWEGRGAL